MSRLITFIRRSVAGIALLTFALTLVWWVRTWEFRDCFHATHEAEYWVDGNIYTNGRGVDIGLRQGEFAVNAWTFSLNPRKPDGWRFEHTRTNAYMIWVPPYTINSDMSGFYDLVLDGVQPFLHRHGIGCRLYVANDGSAAFGEKLVPDPTGGIFFLMLLPLWLIALFSALIFLLAVRPDWRARRRRVKGLCVGCGYDLRGSIASGRCSECGRVVDDQQMEKLRQEC